MTEGPRDETTTSLGESSPVSVDSGAKKEETNAPRAAIDTGPFNADADGDINRADPRVSWRVTKPHPKDVEDGNVF